MPKPCWLYLFFKAYYVPDFSVVWKTKLIPGSVLTFSLPQFTFVRLLVNHPAMPKKFLLLVLSDIWKKFNVWPHNLHVFLVFFTILKEILSSRVENIVTNPFGENFFNFVTNEVCDFLDLYLYTQPKPFQFLFLSFEAESVLSEDSVSMSMLSFLFLLSFISRTGINSSDTSTTVFQITQLICYPLISWSVFFGMNFDTWHRKNLGKCDFNISPRSTKLLAIVFQ